MGKLIGRLGLGEWVAGFSSLALLAFMFVPWFRWRSSLRVFQDGKVYNVQMSLTAWEAFSVIDYIILVTGIVAIGWVLLRMIRPAGSSVVLSPIIVAGFGLLSVALVLKNIAVSPIDYRSFGEVTVPVETTAAVGLFLGLAATAGITIGSLISVWRQARSPSDQPHPAPLDDDVGTNDG